MSKVIPIVLAIVLVIGLAAYTMFPKKIAFQNTSDVTDLEITKVNTMLTDASTVMGNTVKSYWKESENTKNMNSIDQYEVLIYDERGRGQDVKEVRDNALYRISKEYNTHGKLSVVTFDQIDLSSTSN